MDWDLVERALGDPAFCAVMESLGHHLVSPQELASMELPEGLTPELLWKICLRLRRLMGFHVFEAQQRWGSPGIWYNLPQEVVKKIGSIYARSELHSPLGRVLGVRGLSGFRLDAQAREISDSLRRDGLYLPLEAARSMASQERPPLTPEEVLACNYCDMLRRTLAEPTLKWSMARLCEALSQGSAQPCVLRSSSITKRIDQILSHVTSRDKDPQSNDPLCVSAWLYNAPDHVKVSSSLNDLLGNVLRKVYLIECGYPGLALLPLGSEQVNESLKEWGPSSMSHPELLDAFEDSYDVTWYDSHYIDIVDAQLTEAEQEAYYERRRIDMLTETIRSSTRLNHRQADVLLRALRSPDVVFDYADHQQRYAVSYATARKDIGALVTMGLLYSSVTPEAMLQFHPSPSLEHALLRLGKSG